MDWIIGQPTALVVGYASLIALLLAGSVAAYTLPRLQPGRWKDLPARVKTWWAICASVGGALLLGWQASTIVFGLISFIALREYLTLAPTRREDRLAVLFVYSSVLISYWSIWIDTYPYFLVIVPIYVFVATAVLMALIGRPDGFLATVGIMHWGVIVCVFNLGHAAFLMRTPVEETPQAGPAGLVFFLIAITVFSDAAQYGWDRLIGKHKISARISDDKTWEGLLGGTLTSWIVFVFLAPFFSPLPFWPSVFVSGILPIWGAAGSLTMSAVKRDLGVSSSSLLLPGFGGALDRIASLTFTAPWFFHMHAIFALERF